MYLENLGSDTKSSARLVYLFLFVGRLYNSCAGSITVPTCFFYNTKKTTRVDVKTEQDRKKNSWS